MGAIEAPLHDLVASPQTEFITEVAATATSGSQSPLDPAPRASQLNLATTDQNQVLVAVEGAAVSPSIASATVDDGNLVAEKDESVSAAFEPRAHPQTSGLQNEIPEALIAATSGADPAQPNVPQAPSKGQTSQLAVLPSGRTEATTSSVIQPTPSIKALSTARMQGRLGERSGTVVASAGGKVLGALELSLSSDDQLSVRLGDLLSLFHDRMDETTFVRLSTSLSAREYVTLDTLIASGFKVGFDPRTKQLNLALTDRKASRGR